MCDNATLMVYSWGCMYRLDGPVTHLVNDGGRRLEGESRSWWSGENLLSHV